MGSRLRTDNADRGVEQERERERERESESEEERDGSVNTYVRESELYSEIDGAREGKMILLDHQLLFLHYRINRKGLVERKSERALSYAISCLLFLLLSRAGESMSKR